MEAINHVEQHRLAGVALGLPEAAPGNQVFEQEIEDGMREADVVDRRPPRVGRLRG